MHFLKLCVREHTKVSNTLNRYTEVIGALILCMILQTTCEHFCSCLRLKSERKSKLSQKRCFKGFLVVR